MERRVNGCLFLYKSQWDCGFLEPANTVWSTREGSLSPVIIYGQWSSSRTHYCTQFFCVSMTTKSRVFCYVREHLSICTQKQGDIASLQLILWKRATWQDRKCPVRRRKKSSQTKFISRNKETKERGNIPAVSVTMNWVWMSRQSSHVSVF